MDYMTFDLTSYYTKHFSDVRRYSHKIMSELIEGLKELHAKNIRHSDLKPFNVLIKIKNGVPTAKISDFNSACTSAHIGYGTTICYRAPESIHYQDELCSDIWSLGCVYYEILRGKTLFRYGKGTDYEYGLQLVDFFHNGIKGEFSTEERDILSKMLCHIRDRITLKELSEYFNKGSI